MAGYSAAGSKKKAPPRDEDGITETGFFVMKIIDDVTARGPMAIPPHAEGIRKIFNNRHSPVLLLAILNNILKDLSEQDFITEVAETSGKSSLGTTKKYRLTETGQMKLSEGFEAAGTKARKQTEKDGKTAETSEVEILKSDLTP